MTHFFLTLRRLTQLESATGGIAIRKPQRLSACIASLLVCGIIAPQQASAVDDAGLVKQLNNQISALISVPIKDASGPCSGHSFYEMRQPDPAKIRLTPNTTKPRQDKFLRG